MKGVVESAQARLMIHGKGHLKVLETHVGMRQVGVDPKRSNVGERSCLVWRV